MAQNQESALPVIEATESFQPAGGEVAIPEAESQIALVDQRIPSEIVVGGGQFTNANFGPHTSTHHYEAKQYKNTTVNEVHHHYYEKSSNQDTSTSGPQSSGKTVEEAAEVLEEGYLRISESTVMYETKPMVKSTNIYEGYREYHGTSNRLPVAIKKIILTDQEHLKEVQLLVTLASHPNVVRILESKKHTSPHAQVLYIVMELCSLQNLQDYLDANREKETPFDFKKTMDFTKQLLSGMKHIHDNGIVHRDVKPENVLLSTDNTQLKFVDFGLGKELRQGRTSTNVTFQGQGSMGYRAPETFSSDKVSRMADIFSLGITLFGLWSNGNHPFGANIYFRDGNIIENKNPDFTGVLIAGAQRKDFLDLVTRMLQHDYRLRPTIDHVLEHSFIKNGSSEIPTERQQSTTSSFSQTPSGPNQSHMQVIRPKKEVRTEEQPSLNSGQRQSGVDKPNQTLEEESLPNTAAFSVREGKQPLGEMSHRWLGAALPGHSGYGTMEITYKFPEGSSNEVHHESREFKAYLPGTCYPKLTSSLYTLLESVFSAGQVFKLRYRAEEKTGEIVWGDIPHKTNKIGGAVNNGYPDPEYFKRLRAALREKGFWDTKLDRFID